MKKFCHIAALAVLLGCTSGSGDALPTLSVSIEPQRKLLEEIVGDRYQVVTILANGANPETYDPTLTQRVDADRSLAYFTTGYMPFEQTLAKGLDGNVRVVNTSQGITPLTGTHSHGHGSHADEPDPHVWTSVRNATLMAYNMAEAMASLDPDNADTYRSRYGMLKQRLDSLDSALSRQLSDAGAHAFLIWHPSLSYYARDYGLHQIAAGQESKEMTVKSIKAIIDEAKADSVQVFFFQKEYDSRQAQNLNKEAGTRMVTINPLDYDWDQQLIQITNELTR